MKLLSLFFSVSQSVNAMVVTRGHVICANVVRLLCGSGFQSGRQTDEAHRTIFRVAYNGFERE